MAIPMPGQPPPRGKPLRVSPCGLNPPRLAAHLWTYTTSWDINGLLQQWEAVHDWRSRGQRIATIARELDLDRKTVRSCLWQAAWQPYWRAEARSLLDAHRQWLTERAREVNYSARILWQELRAQRGFAGSYVIVRRAMAPLRLAASVSRAAGRDKETRSAPRQQRCLTCRST